MFRDERDLARWLVESIRTCSAVKKVISGGSIPKRSFEDLLKTYFSTYAPTIMARPDIVVVTEDLGRVVDGWCLAALELKYFKKPSGKSLRKAYREVGQALRYHLLGFDLAILWHIFEENIDDALIESYSELITEFIDKLKLPLIYFATKINEVKGEFLVFKPAQLTKISDTCYIISWMLNYCKEGRRNTLLPGDKEVLARRKALRALLMIP